jgi:DNA modification methylase
MSSTMPKNDNPPIATMAERIELWPVERLQPYAKNARTHSDEQVDQIAASIREFGFTNPILVDSADGIIAGHGRLMAAKRLGLATVPVIVLDHLTDAQRRAYILADNKLALNAGWDTEMLVEELQQLDADGFDLDLTGFSDEELADLIADNDNIEPVPEGDPEQVPEPQPDPVSVTGDVWLLGKHRVMCGDSTSISDVEKLMAGATAQLLHADPPYGMGKASDGVANDNIYEEDLDKFQMEWWATFRTFLTDKASAYIWGNAPDLWRLWYRGGLGDSEHLELRNQIVWDKKNMAGMKSPDITQYVVTTEHCLFFQLGNQFLGNVNATEFPDNWEPLRHYMEGEAKAAGMKSADVKRICGVQMWGHWFTRSQFQLIPQKYYDKLAAEYPSRFARPWRELKAEWDRVNTHDRSYFDNAHDIMRDVWEFPRVTGDERHGHATPKPVAMMERVMKSSLPKGGLCLEPFGGSGATLMGAEKAGRVCYTMELQGKYVDVIVRRWQDFTGKQATLEGDGRTFDELAAERVPAAA